MSDTSAASDKAQSNPNELNDGELEQLRVKYAKIGVVEFSGHQIVFKKPTRDHIRDYRRKKDSDTEKMDAMDQLAQVTIVAYDRELDPNAARERFTMQFLEAYPMAISNPKFVAVLQGLAGILEEEDVRDLGKGASVRSAPPATSPKVSPNGLAASSTARQ
jgi:hypothetical protein